MVTSFLSRRRYGKKITVTDVLTYLYLFAGVVIMFGPVVWLVLSSFKTRAALNSPPTLLPYRQRTVAVADYDDPLPLYNVRLEDGTTRQLVSLPDPRDNGDEWREKAAFALMIDPATPEMTPLVVPITTMTAVEDDNGDKQTATLAGYDQPLPLYDVTFEDGSTRQMAATLRDNGYEQRLNVTYALMIDPDDATMEPLRITLDQREQVEEIHFGFENYSGAMDSFPFWTYLRNSVIVTVVATLVTLIVNSMAAFALSKYKFRGREVIFLIIISTLMVPISVILIPAFLVVSKVGWINNLWGLIIPGAATPTGVFLLRQYMLTIPDELLDSARIDGASEWRIYSQIVLPLARPALAVLAIFSIMWRWNDFLWPLIVVNRTEFFTLQVGLNAFRGALDSQPQYILAMTVLTLLPMTLIFAFLQRYITSGIATTGMK